MIYARYYTLLKIAKDEGWRWVDTNRYGKTAKDHLLHMRNEGFVQYVDGTSYRVTLGIGRRPHGSERLANWYTITFKGLQKLLEIWPNDKKLRRMAYFVIKKVFKPNYYWKDEIHHRSPKKT